MSPFDFFVEAAHNGFTSSLQVTKGPAKIEYSIALVLAQGANSKVVDSVEEAATWLEGAIIDWFPESDFAKRLVRAQAEREQQRLAKEAEKKH